MAAATYLKPHGVLLGAVPILRVDRIQRADQGEDDRFYGDAAIWPTRNKRVTRNARVTISTRDHAAASALAVNTAGNLTFHWEDDTGADVPVAWSNLVVKEISGEGGDKTSAWQIVLEVEAADGVTGPWS